MLLLVASWTTRSDGGAGALLDAAAFGAVELAAPAAMGVNAATSAMSPTAKILRPAAFSAVRELGVVLPDFPDGCLGRGIRSMGRDLAAFARAPVVPGC